MNTDGEQITEFKSLLEELRKQLLNASIHFDICVQLWPTEQVVDVINRHRGFFQPARNAHFDCFTIRVCDVVSNNAKSPSFYRVFSMLVNNAALAPGLDVRSLKKRLKSHKEVLRAIKQYRNTKAAHLDTEIRAQQEPILFGDSKRMLKELQDIFNEISRVHSGNVWSFRTSQQSDTSSLLNALKIRHHKPTGKLS